MLPGDQAPRVSWVPPYVSTAGPEVVELAELAGLDLDPWQRLVVTDSHGERPDGKWAAFEVGVCVARQNGKGGILESIELGGLFLLGDRLIIHSAHQFDTSLEAFGRLLALIEDNPEFDARVQRVSRSHGEEGIALKNRQRIRFRTRTKGGGRGFTCDRLIIDEAMDFPEAVQGALMPTMSARPNPQIYYMGSAVDQMVHEHGIVFARVRERGHAGGDPSLAWFEWSVDEEALRLNPALALDPVAWAQANPALGIRIAEEHVAKEQRSMAPRTFAVERLSVGDWPRTDGKEGRMISEADWQACASRTTQIAGTPVFALDVTPERSYGSLAVAGWRDDRFAHVEVVEHEAGTSWIVSRCAKLQKDYRRALFVVDPRGPAASLIPDLEEAKVRLLKPAAGEYAGACGAFFDAVIGCKVFFPAPQPEIATALEGARTLPSGDGAWIWSRKSSQVAISPLVAVTLALWGLSQQPPPKTPGIVSLADVLARAEERDARARRDGR